MSPDPANRLDQPVSERDQTKGPDDAPVVFLEYGDYECPHCLQAHSIIGELQDRMGEKFRYVYRHFPIRTSHPRAQRAAEAAEAAGVQGKFWEMHDKLFENQEDLSDESLIGYAAEIGLDVERFQRELEDKVHAKKVQEDFRSGVKSGVNGTPTFYINGERYDGPWDVESLVEEIEKPLGVQVRNLFQSFTRIQASGGILLMLSTLLAFLLANSAMAERVASFWDTYLTISFGDFSLSEDLLHWVNDGLMVLFFFVVGLEIKREITVGELASPRRALLPVMAALGGIVVPAGIFWAFNAGTQEINGWAIPVATDIAFTLGLLALLGRRVPISLKVFFTALAIVDDLAAVLIIAIFYSGSILWVALGIGGLILLILIGLNWAGVRNPLPYAVLGLGLWLAFLQSGVHPTIAGVLLALTIPAKTRVRAQAFMAQCIAVLGGVDAEEMQPMGQDLQENDRQQAAAHTLEAIAERMQSPAQRLEHSLAPWASYLVLPIFALANAGVSLSADIGAALGTRLSLGIIIGLVFGKSIGITVFTWLAVNLGIAEMPNRVEWPQLFSATWLAGIGFTMSLFIAGSAFDSGALLNTAKLSILVASVLAGTIGFVAMVLTSRYRDSHSEVEQKASMGIEEARA
ncbi:MAG: Na+/H+ antiporter NhaA [Anaerolineales bacterium]|jgi:NhaA family Na+:H+ antiporter